MGWKISDKNNITQEELNDDFEVLVDTGTEYRALTLDQLHSYDDYISGESPYGVRWDTTNSDPSASLTKGIIQNEVFKEYEYSSYPIQSKMKRGLLKNNGDWFPLDPNDSRYLMDGSLATLDGSDGQVMVQIPTFYMIVTTDGTDKYFLISEKPFSFKGINAWKPKGFKGVDYVYISAFEGSVWENSTQTVNVSGNNGEGAADTVNDKMYSVAYAKPWTNERRSEYRDLATNTGDIFHQWDWGILEIIYLLYITEYANWNTQQELPGFTEESEFEFYKVRHSGRTLSLGNNSGSILATSLEDSDLPNITPGSDYIAMSYRGIENVFGNVWKFVDGINIDNRDGLCKVYTCYDPSNFIDDTTTNYIDTNHAPAFGDSDGYVVDIKGSGQYCPFYPSNISGGSSSTYLCDYHYNTSGSWRVLRVGGSLHNGDPAGFFYLHAHSSSSLDISYIGSRLAAYVGTTTDKKDNPIYGVKWDTTNSDPSASLTKGFIQSGSFISTSYEGYPIQDKMHRGLLQSDGTWTPLDPDDSNYDWNGNPVSLDGTEGQVMVRIDKFYMLVTTDGTDKYFLISEDPFVYNGESAFIPNGFKGKDYIYISAFEGSLYNSSTSSLQISGGNGSGGANTSEDLLYSVVGCRPWTNERRSEYRTLSENMNTGTVTYHQWDWGILEIIYLLYITEYANWNTQQELPGFTEASSFDHSFTRYSGRTVELGNNSGSILCDLTGDDGDLDSVITSSDYIAMSYRGIENVFGNVWKFVDGINIDNRDGDCHVFVSYTVSTFTDDTSGGDYIDTNHAPAFGDSVGYVVDIKGSGQYCPFYPSNISGGSSSTYLCDYHYNTSGSWRVLYVGGLLSRGDLAGFFCLLAYYSSSLANSDIGSRLAAYV